MDKINQELSAALSIRAYKFIKLKRVPRIYMIENKQKFIKTLIFLERIFHYLIHFGKEK